MDLKPNANVYFMGIGGTGMASVAGLAQQAGYQVSGSDKDLYPPMSIMLDELKIKVKTPYSKENLKELKPDLIVVANSLSRGHEEVEYMLDNKLAYTSFPQFLGELFLSKRAAIVVTGTHGKTTTTSLIAHLLHELGENPSFLIGGVPVNFPRSFSLNKEGKTFVIEGDEYDTAFFDKGSKFLHYFPKYLLVNNIEFDHADIFKSLEDIEKQFAKVINLAPSPTRVIANTDDPGVHKLLNELGIRTQVRAVSSRGLEKSGPVFLESAEPLSDGSITPLWRIEIQTKRWGALTIRTVLTGIHNASNICMALCCLDQLIEDKEISLCSNKKIVEAVESFRGVKRRLEHLGTHNNINVYEDFAHHPTAVKLVLESLKKSNPDHRLLVAFEPKNATSRRNIFTADFAKSLAVADLVFIGKCPEDLRIPENQRMSTKQLSELIGKKSSHFDSNEALLNSLVNVSKPGDTIVFMSSGSFSGIQHSLIKHLQSKGIA